MRKNLTKKNLFVFAVSLLLGGLGYLFWDRMGASFFAEIVKPKPSGQSLLPEKLALPSKTTEPQMGKEDGSGTPESSSPGNGKDLDGGASGFPSDTSWVADLLADPPVFSQPQTYAASVITMVFPKGCQRPSQAWKTFESAMKSRNLVGIQQFPKGAHLEYLNQFWQLDGKTYQLGLTWEWNEPPTYLVEMFSSTDPTMNTLVQDEPIPWGKGDKRNLRLDPTSALELVQRILSRAKEAGAREGGRTLMLSRLTKGMREEVEYLNGNPIKYSGLGLYCLSNKALTAASCYCPGEKQ